MKEYGTLMFFSLAGLILFLAFTERVEAVKCVRIQKDGEVDDKVAVMKANDDLLVKNHKWMICNRSERIGGANEMLWLCDISSDEQPTDLITNRFNWSSGGDISFCKRKVHERRMELDREAEQLRGRIGGKDKEVVRLRAACTQVDREKKQCEEDIGRMAGSEGKVRSLQDEKKRVDALFKQEEKECENRKIWTEGNYKERLEKVLDEIQYVKRAIELKEQQLEKLGNNNCPACDAGTCWDDVHIKENLDKLYGKDGWKKSGVKCGVSHEGNEESNSKYNENM
ncbi:hypothetical protein, conserved [Trypanosoma brucei brucei TREU927]|uniref:T. brucei spp.-specific protein n=1 Tax=Trypanosoma brucei brucei (strain 927/4 GUTat10.1) TaxID=185431 RepID=Q38EG7_TRYB2|nr:hypothetical protein, conserved [Trypanosoma brucei brucei TREU927]EAN76803.1 hypothetical protein, conserved [Trypanosoma brucei brucei TREU927]